MDRIDKLLGMISDTDRAEAEALLKQLLDDTARQSASPDYRLTQRELEESRQFLRTVIDTLPIRVFWKDRNSAYLGANQSFTQDAGFNHSEELLGKTDFDLSWPYEETLAFRADDRRVIESDIPKIGFEEPMTKPDGVTYWLKTNKLPLKNPDGQTIGVLGTYEDITERKHMEMRLMQTQFAVDHLSDAAYWCDKEGRITYVNQSSTQALGYTKDELLHMHMADVDPEIIVEQWPKHWEVLKKANHSLTQRVHRRKDGSTFPVEFKISYLDFEGAQLLCCFARDITGELEREEQLRQSQKMESVGQLAGGIAHDLNNLLTPIMGYSEMLLDSFPEDGFTRRALKHIDSVSMRARDLVRQLLAFSRKQEMREETLNLNTVLIGFEELLRRTIRENVKLTCIPNTEPLCIRGDRGQLEQILMNLSLNAQDAMPNGGELIVSLHTHELTESDLPTYQLHTPGDYALLRVQDTGSGIPPAIIEKIFEPFFTTKEVGEGTGLGLSTVFGIVKQHNGGLQVHSVLGHGTLFELAFPFDHEMGCTLELDELPRPEPAPLVHRHATIWIAEDEEVVREMMVEGLKNQNYSTTSFESPLMALELTETNPTPPDLLISDVIMPEMDGTKLAGKLREIYPNLKVLFISGYSRSKISSASLPDATAFIKKPFALSELSRTVTELLNEEDHKA